MDRIFVLAEHRKGGFRDITWEMLNKGRELASGSGSELIAVLLGYGVKDLAQQLAQRADQVLFMEHERLENFNSETYQKVLSNLIAEYKPGLTLIGHTAFGMDLAPSLAAQLELPLSTDCVDLHLEGGELTTIRQKYADKVNAEISFPGAKQYIVTVRPGSFPMDGEGAKAGEIKGLSLPVEEIEYKRFIEYVEAALGEVDIAQADVLVSVGNGIGDVKNIPIVSELADALGATLSCSRPVVDKKWLPKERQVGTSGKTIKPKVYLAVGISGAFQHIAGIKGGTIIAINKDPKAPIFRVADYGIVGDLFKVVPLLKRRVSELKAG
ncbi:electron transfer flavoprotein subunit alpha/FixB family protein [Chloroflexota bacterium]